MKSNNSSFKALPLDLRRAVLVENVQARVEEVIVVELDSESWM